MLKNVVKLEHKIGERVYQLLCDHDSPVFEVKEALSTFFEFAQNVEKEASEKAVSSQEEKLEELKTPEVNQ